MIVSQIINIVHRFQVVLTDGCKRQNWKLHVSH